MKKTKIDPKKVVFDGSTFHRVVKDHKKLMKWLKRKQKEIYKHLGLK